MAAPFVPQPGAPLLQFPGEVRNKIIRNIFKQGDYILLLPFVGPLTHPSWPVMTCAVPDTQVFLTCRQFYGETRSILLEDNTFMLSTQFDAYADASSLGLFSRWMRSLGPYRDYVRKVIINLSPLCPGPCHLARPWIDLKPIMVEIWRYQTILTSNHSRQRANIKMSFAFSGRQLRGHVHHPAPHTPSTYTIDQASLNAMITLLTPQRSPEMSPYLQSLRVLREIRTRVDGLQALFVLTTTHHQDHTEIPIIEFNMDGNRQLVRRRHDVNQEDDINRLHFATSIRETLLRMLLGRNVTQLTYLIDSRTISQRLPETFSINRHFRDLALEKYPNVHVVGKLTSYSAQATFANMESMQSWCMASRMFVGNHPEEHQDNAPTILMRFELSTHEVFSNLRIPITNIIMATLHLLLNTELRVELIRLDLPDRAKAAVQTATLYRLQRQLFVFLADILDLHPNRSAQTCPNVMMDGYCQIEEVEYEREDGSKFLVQKPKVRTQFGRDGRGNGLSYQQAD